MSAPSRTVAVEAGALREERLGLRAGSSSGGGFALEVPVFGGLEVGLSAALGGLAADFFARGLPDEVFAVVGGR